MLLKNIKENFPFISVVTYGGEEFVGIISNQDNNVTSMYVYSKLNTDEEKSRLLELGQIWWWESNRMIPINIFIRKEMESFRHCLVMMSTKDVKVTMGPCVNLNNLAVKRVKRKSIQLIKKPRS